MLVNELCEQTLNFIYFLSSGLVQKIKVNPLTPEFYLNNI